MHSAQSTPAPIPTESPNFHPLCFLWLGWLAFFAEDWPQMTQADTLLAAAGIGLFIPLFYLAWKVQGSRLVAVICGMLFIGIVLYRVNTGALSMFIFAAAFCGKLPTRQDGLITLTGVVMITGLSLHVFNAEALDLYVGVLMTVLVGWFNLIGNQNTPTRDH